MSKSEAFCPHQFETSSRKQPSGRQSPSCHHLTVKFLTVNDKQATIKIFEVPLCRETYLVLLWLTEMGFWLQCWESKHGISNYRGSTRWKRLRPNLATVAMDSPTNSTPNILPDWVGIINSSTAGVDSNLRGKSHGSWSARDFFFHVGSSLPSVRHFASLVSRRQSRQSSPTESANKNASDTGTLANYVQGLNYENNSVSTQK